MTSSASTRHVWMLVGIVLAEFAVLSVLRPDAYPTVRNVVSMGFQMSEIGILALAVGVTLLAGGIDLSIVATANLSAIVAAGLMTRLVDPLGVTTAIAVAVAGALVIGMVAGAVNGLLVTRLQVSPIVITLGTLTLYTGIATGVTRGSTWFGVPAFQTFGNGIVAGLPVPLLLLLALAVVLGVLTRQTRTGFRAYMIGASETVARYSRVDVTRLQILAYVTSGCLSAVSGLIILGRTNAASVSFGASYLLLAILVAVLAGINPYGGSGWLLGVPLAMAAMQQLSTGMNMVLAQRAGANFVKEFAWGLLLIAVLAAGRLPVVRQLRRLIGHAQDLDLEPVGRPVDHGRTPSSASSESDATDTYSRGS